MAVYPVYRKEFLLERTDNRSVIQTQNNILIIAAQSQIVKCFLNFFVRLNFLYFLVRLSVPLSDDSSPPYHSFLLWSAAGGQVLLLSRKLTYHYEVISLCLALFHYEVFSFNDICVANIFHKVCFHLKKSRVKSSTRQIVYSVLFFSELTLS